MLRFRPRALVRLLLQHRTHYGYDRPAALGPHMVRLRPATHAKAKIETYALSVDQPCARAVATGPRGQPRRAGDVRAGERVTAFDLLVEMAVDVRPVNPFDFFLDPRCEKMPFEYPRELARDLAPYLDATDPAYATGPLFDAFLAELPRAGRRSTSSSRSTRPSTGACATSSARRAACGRRSRRSRKGGGAAATRRCSSSRRCDRAASRRASSSGYLVQLTDEGMIPDEPRGVARDVVDLHAWAEVYLPGGGWIGLDATSGLLCGEGHIPLACTAQPAAASPDGGNERRAGRKRSRSR